MIRGRKKIHLLFSIITVIVKARCSLFPLSLQGETVGERLLCRDIRIGSVRPGGK